MQRFFVNSNQVNTNDKTIEIINDDVKHIRDVLRLKEKEIIEVCDFSFVYTSEIKTIEKDKVILSILSKNKCQNESNLDITIMQGIPKAEKMEYILQKGTELGVKTFIPVAMDRSISKIENKLNKIERWKAILESASKQSKRDLIPTITSSIKNDELVKTFESYDLVLVAYEEEKEEYLYKYINEIKDKKINNLKIAVIVGPEGGISKEEIKLYKKYNAKTFSLGKRILRTETASLAITSILMYELGDIGGTNE